VLDAVALEARGIPTVTFVTEVFERPARAQARQAGLPDLKIIVAPHRFGWQEPEEVRNIALRLVPELVDGLVAG
jgi:hypothetical protein